MAAVVCCTFLLSWTPYAAVSLMSALISGDDLEAKSPFQAAVEGSAGGASGSPNSTQILDVGPLWNWTALGDVFNSPGNGWSEVNDGDVSAPPPDREAEAMTGGTRPPSPLPPVVTLIPAMLAKSHCMLNPIIYQLMSREFRDDLYGMVLGRETPWRGRGEPSRGSSNESKTQKGPGASVCPVLTSPSFLLSGPVSLLGSRSLSRKRSTTPSPSMEGHTGLEKQEDQKSSGDGVMSACPEALEAQDNMERQANAGRWRNT